MTRRIVILSLVVLLLAGVAGAHAATSVRSDAATGSIAGLVTAADGSPLQDIFVQANGVDGSWGSATTGVDGMYVLSGLPAGSYRIFFSDGTARGYVAEYYNDQSWQNATLVTVTAGAETTGIDAQLALGGAISGTVTSAEGQPLEGITIWASPLATGFAKNAYTAADGTYTITGLAVGSYHVTFSDYTGQGYVTELYDNSPSETGATRVDVAAGAVTKDIDAQLEIGGAIAGTVTDDNGNPLADVWVSAAPTDGTYGRGTTTVADGTYTLTGLRPGSYRVEFRDNQSRGYIPETYSGNVTVAAGATTSSVDAQLSKGGSISGKVTNSAGDGVGGIYVSVQSGTGSGGGWASTAADGTYTALGIADGTYTVMFNDVGGRYSPQYFDHAGAYDTATKVTISGGSNIAGIDAQLELAGSVSGTVTNANGDPISGIAVSAQPAAGSGFGSQVYTGADGTYRLGGLAPGSYRIQFFDVGSRGYVAEFYDDTTAYNAATLVTVGEGADVAHVDAQLALGGSISGRVTNSAGEPIGGISVGATGAAGNGSGTTNADGRYVIAGLAAGSYRISFYDLGPTNYMREYYDDKPTYETATPVVVVAGQETTGIDAQLVAGGSISGKVTDANGQPLGAVSVYASSGAVWGTGWTALDGTYAIHGLPTGSYRVEFSDGQARGYVTARVEGVAVTTGAETSHVDAQLALGGSISGRVTNTAGDSLGGIYIYSDGMSAQTGTDGRYTLRGLSTGTHTVQFYDARSPGYQAAVKSGVDVTAGSDTPNVDAQLALGGAIAGKVTADDGAPIGDILVQVSQLGGSGGTARQTGSDGTYVITGLPPGQYRVQFLDPRPNGVYAGEYFDDQRAFNLATLVVVTAGAETGHVDAALAAGGSISGTLTDAAGNPLSGIRVYASPTVGAIGGGATTGADGRYTIGALPAGAYIISFSDTTDRGYAAGRRDGTVTVAARADTGGIDAQLSVGGSIAGRVTDANGAPLMGITVAASPDDGGYHGFALTRSDGTYVIRGLAPGSYRVEFRDTSTQGLAVEYYDHALYRPAATAISVTAGAQTSDIDARLTPGGAIAGVVTGEDGVPLAGVDVIAALDGVAGVSVAAETAGDGTYTIRGLPSGPYVLRFIDATSRGYPAVVLRPLVTVIAPQTTSGIDMELSFTPADTTPPQLDVPRTVTVEATSANGATVKFEATASDDVDGALTPTCTPASGSVFPLGSTAVRCSATDAAGNTADATFTVVVQDTTAPVVGATLTQSTIEHDVYVVSITATDAVGVEKTKALLNGVLVTNGQSVELKQMSGPQKELTRPDGTLRIEAPSFTLVVTATDAAGNAGTARVVLTIRLQEAA